MTPTRLILAAALLLTGSAQADTIYMNDGESLDEVTIVDETLTAITYRAKGKSTETTLSPDKVARVEFTKKPRLVDEADVAVDEGAIGDALVLFTDFATGVLSGENKRDRAKWAPAYAMQRVLEINMMMGDLRGAIEAADKLIKSTPESRYVPGAYLTKAEAQRWLGKEAESAATLDAFKALIDEKRLSDRWRLEAQLAALLTDTSLSGSAKRDRLADVISAAGNDYSVVKNRAFVAEGESFLEEAKPDYKTALESFRKIIEDPSSDKATLAGAYTGIGDCLYRQAASALQSKDLDEEMAGTLREALKSYLRVVVVYEDQSRYVQKALFFSGRVFDLFGTEVERANAKNMYRRLLADFPSSNWAADARMFL